MGNINIFFAFKSCVFLIFDYKILENFYSACKELRFFFLLILSTHLSSILSVLGEPLVSDIGSLKPLNRQYHVRNPYERYLLTLEVVGCKQLDVNTWYVLSTTHNWEHGTFKITLMKKTNAYNQLKTGNSQQNML